MEHSSLVALKLRMSRFYLLVVYIIANTSGCSTAFVWGISSSTAVRPVYTVKGKHNIQDRPPRSRSQQDGHIRSVPRLCFQESGLGRLAELSPATPSNFPALESGVHLLIVGCTSAPIDAIVCR